MFSRAIACVGAASALIACAGHSSAPEAKDGAAGQSPEAQSESAPTVEQRIDVEIPASNGVSLSGLLELPAGVTAPPAVLLIHGSGPQDRRHELEGQLNMVFPCKIPVFEDLSQALKASGFAVLRYDKRTCGRFNGCAENDYPEPASDITVSDLMDDAGAALAWLEARPEIDGTRLAVVGLSQGGSMVPSLMDNEQVRSGIMLATPYSPIDMLLESQATFTRELLQDTGAPNADETLRELDEHVRQLSALRHGSFTGDSISGASPEFWLSWMALGDEAPERVQKLDKPVLILSGDYDWNVPPEQNAHWTKAVASSNHSELHQTTVLPCVTHALNCISQPDYRQIVPADIGCEVAASVRETMSEFLHDTL